MAPSSSAHAPLLAHLEQPHDAPQRQLLDAQQQALINQSFVQHLFPSWAWKVSALVREPRRWFRPRGFDATALLAWQQLVASEPNRYRSTGLEPAFLTPCWLPAGWLRVRLRLRVDRPSRTGLYAFHTGSSADVTCLDSSAIAGEVDREFHVYLPRPALALRFEPMDGEGEFVLEQFEVQPLTPPQALARAIRSKWQLLRQHGLVGASLANAAKALVRGDWRRLASKLYAGLQDPSATPTLEGACKMYGSHAARPGIPRQDRLNVVYVLKSAGLCGGVKVVLEHVARLYERGHHAVVYFLDGPPTWFDRPVPAVRFGSPASLIAALKQFRGIKVATWYETAPWVAESLQAGDRGYYLVQDIEESYCHTAEAGDAALATYRLGLKPISEGHWVRDQLVQRWQLDPVFVSIGLDHRLFYPRPVPRTNGRLLTQARTWSGGVAAGASIKGWDIAHRVVLRLAELMPELELCTFSIESAPQLPANVRHTHYQAPSDEQLAELYSQAGVFLLTSRHEGFGLTAAEAMACGTAVVATKAQGNEEFCLHERTALTAAPEDIEALAQHCFRLLTHPKQARELAATAQRRIRTYDWQRVLDRLESEFLRKAWPEIDVNDLSEPEALATEQIPAPAPPIHTSTIEHRPHTLLPTGTQEYPRIAIRPAKFDWSIIIPTINDVKLTTQCIASGRAHMPAHASVQWIVVDDGTADAKICQQLRQAAKELDFELLFNRQNLGFSASVNRGLLRSRGRVAVLCNNDVQFTRPWLEPLAAAFAADGRVGIVGAKLTYPDGTVQHAGMDKVPGQLQFVHTHSRVPADHPEANAARCAWSVTGALFAIRRELLVQLGAFSTAYGTAYEDVDYCLHAWNHGYTVRYEPRVEAIHWEGGTRGATPDQKRERAPLWEAREATGRAYFERKWAAWRHLDSLQPLVEWMQGQPPLAELGTISPSPATPVLEEKWTAG